MINRLNLLIDDNLFTPEIENFILLDRQIALDGNHGVNHWLNVLKLGQKISRKNKADKQVLTYFALLHDSRRIKEVGDNLHGQRASHDLQKELAKNNFLKLDHNQRTQLLEAIANHSISNAKSTDITIQTCWDSDRLDLWRISSEPNPELLYTKHAKTKRMINFAKKLNSIEEDRRGVSFSLKELWKKK
jgi:uncharacterized protein